MEFKHTTVLLKETVDGMNIRTNGIYVDCTLGGAGHSLEICKRLPDNSVLIGIDQDLDAIQAAKDKLKAYEDKVLFVNDNFENIKEIVHNLGYTGVDGIIMDIGVSSYQLDTPERGFSYQFDSPLDMRMNQSSSFSAYDVVNTYGEVEIKNVIKEYGEELWAARIAKFIVEQRKIGPIASTGELVDIIKKAIPAKARRDGPHPAKRTFQAIRIEVNNELGVLKKAIKDSISVLNDSGRLCIITFHSLEDRIVKNMFKESSDPCTCPPKLPKCICGKVSAGKVVTRKPILPSEDEVNSNPRSRSAKLRIFEKLV